ncbi:MAG: potassium channel family protein [Thermoanaerobaculales bacterium]
MKWGKFRFFGKHMYRDLLITMAVIITGRAIVPNRLVGAKLDDLVLTAILVVALLEITRSRRHVWIGVILGLPAIASRLVNAFTPDSVAVGNVVLGITSLFFGFLIWQILHDLLKGNRSTGEQIFGAICAYLFIGALFALVFAHAEFVDPGAFSVSENLIAVHGDRPLSLFTYFSFVTLTTLGYGDITPISEAARTLAWFEALVGQLYLAVMIAGLVAVHISGGRQGRQGSTPPAPDPEDPGDQEPPADGE